MTTTFWVPLTGKDVDGKRVAVTGKDIDVSDLWITLVRRDGHETDKVLWTNTFHDEANRLIRGDNLTWWPVGGIYVRGHVYEGRRAKQATFSMPLPEGGFHTLDARITLYDIHIHLVLADKAMCSFCRNAKVVSE